MTVMASAAARATKAAERPVDSVEGLVSSAVNGARIRSANQHAPEFAPQGDAGLERRRPHHHSTGGLTLRVAIADRPRVLLETSRGMASEISSLDRVANTVNRSRVKKLPCAVSPADDMHSTLND